MPDRDPSPPTSSAAMLESLPTDEQFDEALARLRDVAEWLRGLAGGSARSGPEFGAETDLLEHVSDEVDAAADALDRVSDDVREAIRRYT